MSKDKLIRNILIISIAIGIIFPLVNLYLVFPVLNNLLVENAEEEALRVGNHLSGMLLKTNSVLTHETVSSSLSLHTSQTLLEDFQLMKLKVFSSTGEVLYSSSPEEIGQTNTHTYFRDVVARGNTYTKVVKKDRQSLEGETVSIDVVETYVPIVVDNAFLGAYEIYYDISSRNKNVSDFIVLSSTVTIVIMFCYLSTLIFLIIKSDRRKQDAPAGLLPEKYRSPFHLMLLLTLSLFLSETAIMLLLSVFPPLSTMIKAFFDAAMLVIIVSPMLYFLMLRPLLSQIADLSRAKDQIYHMSLYDELTSLPNRSLFEDRLQQSILHAERYKRKAAVLFLDLDNFKRINDVFEHRTGDLILKEIAQRLASHLRLTDSVAFAEGDEDPATIARIGGDEFTILLTEIKSLQDAATVAERIRNALSQPFSILNQEVFVTASIGIATYPADGKDVESLLKNAHSATYYAKEHGRNSFHFYEGSMNDKAYARLILENDLRRALDNEEFILHYQPRIDVISGQIISLEALIRWVKPGRGMIPPMEFIPLAEESGLILPIGEWVLRKACEQTAKWKKTAMPHASVSVNISVHQFQDRNFVGSISRILSGSGMEPGALELEITESIMMTAGVDAQAILMKLKDMGIRLSVDDFGTGYSSFSYLKRFPIDVLKIDRSFIRDITVNNDSQAIVEAIIAMAHRLQLRTVAEGVETEEQQRFLEEIGCDEIQGYFITPPLPAEEIRNFLANQFHKTGIQS